MGCPLYKKDTQECINTFESLVLDVSPTFCKSKEFSICPFYKILVKKQNYCKYIQNCGKRFHQLNSIVHHDTNTHKRITNLIFNYCLTEKNKDCQRLKLGEQGKNIPNELLPDGSILTFRELFGKNIKY